MAAPSLVEYKPSNATSKTRSSKLARQSFGKVIDGEKISQIERKNLENTRAFLLNTRGKGQQFHGTSREIDKLISNIENTNYQQNIYGAGFYTTDALDIADGYSKSKRKAIGSQSDEIKNLVYQVIEKKSQKLYDMEQPIDEFRRIFLKYKARELAYNQKYQPIKYKNMKPEDFRLVDNKVFDMYEVNIENKDFFEKTIYDDKIKNLRELYNALGLDRNALEAQLYFNRIRKALQNSRYEGLSHKGGLLTNNPEHLVKIYWKPENLEIQEFSYPKEFKKARKVAKPPEIPATLTKKPEPEAKVEKAKPVRQKAASKKEIKKEIKPHLKPAVLEKQKKFILDKVEGAIKSPTDADKLTIEVPQDGTFKINNNPKALETFKTKVQRNWPGSTKATYEAPYPKHESLSNKLPEPEIKEYKAKNAYGANEIVREEIYNELYKIEKNGAAYKVVHLPSNTVIGKIAGHTNAKKYLSRMYAKGYGKEQFYRAENKADLEAMLDMKELEKIHKSLNKS